MIHLLKTENKIKESIKNNIRHFNITILWLFYIKKKSTKHVPIQNNYKAALFFTITTPFHIYLLTLGGVQPSGISIASRLALIFNNYSCLQAALPGYFVPYAIPLTPFSTPFSTPSRPGETRGCSKTLS